MRAGPASCPAPCQAGTWRWCTQLVLREQGLPLARDSTIGVAAHGEEYGPERRRWQEEGQAMVRSVCAATRLRLWWCFELARFQAIRGPGGSPAPSRWL